MRWTWTDTPDGQIGGGLMRFVETIFPRVAVYIQPTLTYQAQSYLLVVLSYYLLDDRPTDHAEIQARMGCRSEATYRNVLIEIEGAFRENGLEFDPQGIFND